MSEPFRLIRVYSLKSFFGIAVVALALVFFYRAIAVDALKQQETKFNVALAQSLSITVWPTYSGFVRSAKTLPVDRLAAEPEIRQLHHDIAEKVRGLKIIKVKIYDSSGLTVFSTDRSQIGEIKAENEGFLVAMAGSPASELVFKDTFSAFEDVIENRNVLSSYIPIRQTADASIEGVFEIYSDVTPLVWDISRTGYTILGGVTSLSLLLYLFLLVTVRRADQIIKRQGQETQQRQQAKIQYLAHFDALTDLPNRTRYMEILAQAIRRAKDKAQGLGVICIAIDKFKIINDSLGHELGDKVLIEVARRLRASVHDGGTVARMGGDQFAIVIEGLSSQQTATFIAENIIGKFGKPIHEAGHEIVVTLSMGITIRQEEEEQDNAAQVVENAIAAMRVAKDKGRNCFVIYTREINAKAHGRFELEMGLRKALANREFVLHYQPRVNSETGRVNAVEALVRWQHPNQELVRPAEFIYLLEDMDLMVPVGEWIIAEACRQTKTWHDSGYPKLRVSVNLSLRQFRSDTLLNCVRKALGDSGLPAQYLELELTESVLADDIRQATNILRSLKELGVSLAIDDFGTGYSSLSYLMHFPVNCLKIDRSFIGDVTTNKDSAALTTAITAMAKSLGLETVAEGVETSEQLRFVTALGCTEVQGYLIGEPLPAEKLTDSLLDARSFSLTRHLIHMVQT